MRAEDTRMFAEAAQAPSIVRAQLRDNAGIVAVAAARLRASPPTAALICGRGSSDNAGVFGRYLIEAETGVLTSPAPLAVSSVYGRVPRIPGGVCLAISQSGKSPDLVAAACAARAGGGFGHDAGVVPQLGANDRGGLGGLGEHAGVFGAHQAGPSFSSATKS